MLFFTVLACFRLSPEDLDNTLDADGDGFEDATWGGPDCDPSDPEIHPDAEEVCDGVDNDCSGGIDDEASDFGTWYADADGDGFGDADSPQIACEQPSGTVEDSSDCDDAEALSYPGGTETCDGIDNDCDGEVDEESTDLGTWYEDSDGDGYGDIEAPVSACTQPSGTVEEVDATDCDDSHASVYPGATEHCDDVDWDCDGESGYETNVPEHYSSIQEAIDNHQTGDRICVRAGVYNENVVINGSYPLIEGEGSGLTVIDAQGSGTPLRVYNSNASTKVKGFTLTGGTSTDGLGAGLHIWDADGVFVDIELADNEMDYAGQCLGGVVYARSSDLEFRRVVIRDNIVSCREAWGLVELASTGTIVFENLSMVDNLIQATDFVQGGFATYGAMDLVVDNWIYAGNEVGISDDSGSVYGMALVPTIVGTVTVSNATWTGNTADAAGGDVRGVYWSYGYSADFVNLSVTGNVCSGASVSSCGMAGDYTMAFSNVWDNDPINFSGTDPTGQDGNIKADPSFVDTSASLAQDWDLHLGEGSKLIDAGDPSILDEDGSDSDIGAHGGPLGESW